ncbi:kinase-like protein [Gigaspora margarita]|uniref:Kinase-like protein n=1 Tax=Gigaspora margarita TaxID=4874 RepID=A0A8H4API1_GIGMA|nr:kinase-like protein [Gigaspora margarita]
MLTSKFGVLPYMELEIVKEGKYSYASNIYAFGILLIKITTGKHIYGANNNDRPPFDELIPSFYQNIIHPCCDKEPSNRPNEQTLTMKSSVGN